MCLCQSSAGACCRHKSHRPSYRNSIPRWQVEPVLWTWEQRSEHVRVQELHDVSRTVPSISRRFLQRSEPSDDRQSNQYLRWSRRRLVERSKDHPKQSPELPLLSIVTEICVLAEM